MEFQDKNTPKNKPIVTKEKDVYDVKNDKLLLSEKTNSELRSICSDFGIIGVSKKTKEELINIIILAKNKDMKDQSKTEEKTSEIKKDGNSLFAKGSTLMIQKSYGEIESNAENKSMKIKVSCGSNVKDFPVVGYTVSHVIEHYSHILNIGLTSDINVNGTPIKDLNYILKETDSLEFVKKTGSKA